MHTRRVALLASSALLMSAPRLARGQGTAPLPAGARVRLQLADSLRPGPFAPRAQRVIGTVVRDAGGVIALEVGARDTLRLARASVERIAVSRGASRTRSALQQAAFGAFSLAAVGAFTRSGDDRSEHVAARRAALGAGIGVIVGTVSPYERWRTIRR
ncbi:MAG TPA: hypothetical protein VEZ47_00540 [Gemmatirosa sp.]|nr:hypothetical protein [Gemmatirosa sp.]